MTTTKPLEQRIGVGSRVYHLTDRQNMRSIREQCLHSRTQLPLSVSGFLDIPWHKGFIVCSATRDFQDWKDLGLYSHLVEWVSLYSGPEMVKLSFTLENLNDCLVME